MASSSFAITRVLHWIIAATAIGALASGYGLTQSDAFALSLLRLHIALGMTAGLLTALRVVIWLKDGPPPPVFSIRSRVQVRISRWVHGLLRLAPLVLLASGIGMVALSGSMPAIVEGTLPGLSDFEPLPPRRLHHAAALGLALLVGLHALAAVWHALHPARPRTN